MTTLPIYDEIAVELGRDPLDPGRPLPRRIPRDEHGRFVRRLTAVRDREASDD